MLCDIWGVTLKLYIKIEWSKQKLSILKIRLTDDLEIPGRLPTWDKSALDIYLCRVTSTFIKKILKQHFFNIWKKNVCLRLTLNVSRLIRISAITFLCTSGLLNRASVMSWLIAKQVTDCHTIYPWILSGFEHWFFFIRCEQSHQIYNRKLNSEVFIEHAFVFFYPFQGSTKRFHNILLRLQLGYLNILKMFLKHSAWHHRQRFKNIV